GDRVAADVDLSLPPDCVAVSGRQDKLLQSGQLRRPFAVLIRIVFPCERTMAVAASRCSPPRSHCCSRPARLMRTRRLDCRPRTLTCRRRAPTAPRQAGPPALPTPSVDRADPVAVYREWWAAVQDAFARGEPDYPALAIYGVDPI